MEPLIPRRKEIVLPLAAPEVIARFRELWHSGDYRFVTFRPDGADNIVIDVVGRRDECGFDEFAAAVPADRVTFAVLLFTFRMADGARRIKQVYFSIVPDMIHVQERMNMAGGVLSKTLNEVSTSQFVMELADKEELVAERVFEKVSRFELDTVDLTATVCAD